MVTHSSKVLLALWVGILVPLHVENYWDIAVGYFDIRIQYLFLVALGLWVIAELILNRGNTRESVLSYFGDPAILCILAMLVFGALGHGLNSENSKRSLFIWIWSAGTFLSVPFAFWYLVSKERLGSWVERSLAIWLAVHSLLVVVDGILCSFESTSFLARVTFNDGMCRPHAWYREPTMYAIYCLFTLFWLRLAIPLEVNRLWKKVLMSCGVLILAGIFASTSRMGWVALILLGATELVVQAFQGRKVSGQKLAIGSLIVFLLVGVLMTVSGNLNTTINSFEKMAKGRDGSLRARVINAKAMLLAFKDHPIIGVGPGVTGAYLQKHYPDDPSLHVDWHYNTGFEKKYGISGEEKKEIVKNVSFSNFSIGELLAEWGLLGTVAFLMALFFMFRTGPPIIWAYWIFVAPVIFITWQTIQRFDVWVAFSMLWILCEKWKKSSFDALR